MNMLAIGDLPPPTDLKMSHFSLSCILLTWAPANVPSFPDVTTLKCYRIYVNGEIEGMVCFVLLCAVCYIQELGYNRQGTV